MKLIVFGANGQLGRELQRADPPHGFKVVAIDRNHADITDEGQVRAVLGLPDVGYVINAAAYTQVDRAETDVELAYLVNHDGARIIAQGCAAQRIPLIHVSTDYVFDGSKHDAYTEDDPIAPLGVYGASKAAGEAAVRAALDEHLIVRTSWVFSAFGQNFVKTILRLARERDELRVVSDQLGRPTPAADLAAALFACVARQTPEASAWGTYHLAGAGRASWHQLAKAIVELQAASSGRSPRVVPITTADYPTPARRPANSELDTRRFTATFGHQPRSWHDGLAEVVGELLPR